MTAIVGTSGWQYAEWREALYGATPKARWLEFFAERFSAVEVNSTFYRLPTDGTIASWRDRTPDGFVFAIKAPRTITHERRLAGVADLVTVLIERVSGLGSKLGPILYQMPPSLRRDDALLEVFLDALPPYPKSVMEFRHPSWRDTAVRSAMAERDVAWCVTAIPSAADMQGSWTYLRLHGGPDYTQYSPEENRAIAEVVAAAPADPVYAFFDNDTGGAAVRDATALRATLASLGAIAR